MTPHPKWTPAPHMASGSQIARFGAFLGNRLQAEVPDSDGLAALALAEPGPFWDAIWDYFGVLGDKGEGPAITGDEMMETRFLPGTRLNYAENLLGLSGPRAPDAPALLFRGEDKVALQWSWAELEAHVSRLQQALRAEGVQQGDRVAGLLPNRPEAIAAMLATLSIGAVWCSASPDFGARAILDRFGQIRPKVLFATDGYWYAGRAFDVAPTLREVVPQLEGLSRTVVIDYLGTAEAVAGTLPRTASFAAFESTAENRPLEFTRLPFDHPAFILFSSGTTGAPKCILHRAGGVLLQHLKEHALHAEVGPGDRLFYFTTLGWMMWNWLCSGLARGATLLLYDGSPFHPGADVLFDYATEAGMTHFGTSAKYIDSLRKAEFVPAATHDLGALRAMFSTGSPLLAENYDYVYEVLKPNLHLASISGGTDILSCFVLGDPTAPVYRGEIQRAGFGLAVEVWTESGRPAGPGEKGELVCTAPFPSMPLGFWGDTGGARYHETYFSRFPGIWCQGDFAERTPSGGFVIHGRSDATLNPGGVRIGTAEIYAEVARFPEVLDAVVVGQETGDDSRVVLFVQMAGDFTLDETLIARIKSAVRRGSSPRHVPSAVLAVKDIPRTRSGKISELAVRDIVNGIEVRNTDALANPEALVCFRDRPELALEPARP
ncbi:acetoacetate--CoA ligase [Allosediminivita pacifica]|uniref:Acetoacetyl-CoA synthetase n=1 Tax=Allosediminivita pacifica TaxID=1267769 RepID=A0A2T6A8Z7_9RHOB|nr:acetoacetate--CoA ligase [Allosediminivita pacifica]PTX40294.1 acetoacetyl-CoA synthetase [Allosediminivita pacifica]GGB26611.1 acetoacetate-CoA ligase [Allosediminivita pacifica]